MAIFELDDSKTLNRKVARSEEVHNALRPYAEAVRDVIASVYARHAHTGEAAGSWILQSADVDWHIVSTDPHILSKEYGRNWAADGEPEGPFHTRGVHALSTVLGEFGA